MTKDNATATEASKAILTLLADTKARAILRAAASKPRSVAELVEECGISSATVYRKIDDLVEVGLLEKEVRIRTHGQNANEFVTRGEIITVMDHGSEGLEVACLGEPEDPEETHHVTNQEAERQ